MLTRILMLSKQAFSQESLVAWKLNSLVGRSDANYQFRFCLVWQKSNTFNKRETSNQSKEDSCWRGETLLSYGNFLRFSPNGSCRLLVPCLTYYRAGRRLSQTPTTLTGQTAWSTMRYTPALVTKRVNSHAHDRKLLWRMLHLSYTLNHQLVTGPPLRMPWTSTPPELASDLRTGLATPTSTTIFSSVATRAGIYSSS